MDWNHAKDLLIMGFAGYIGILAREIVKSINKLNTQVALIIVDTKHTKDTVRRHDTRISRLEEVR